MPDLSLIGALVGGLVVMAVAGDFLVNGAVALARKLGVSPLLAGIFIVGFGTSAPEMLVSFESAMDGSPGLAFGNIVGSNIANVWLVLAIPAIIFPVITGGFGERRALTCMLLATALWVGLTAVMPLHAGIGALFLILILVYCVFTWVTMRAAANRGAAVDIAAAGPATMGPIRAVLQVALGIAGLVAAAKLIVWGGVGVAEFYEVPQEWIGLTLLAIGTSLPEIGAGIAAALRKRGDVLVGNIIGSNLFNILGAGGIVSFFGPIEVANTFKQYDHWAMGLAALTLAVFIFTRSKVTRLAGVLMLLIYVLYIYGLVNGVNLLGLLGLEGSVDPAAIQ